MKRKITLLLLAASSVFKMNSQVLLSEDFTSPFNLATNNWVVINNSLPTSTMSWAQGNNTGGNGTLTAFNGNTNDFYMADFLSVNNNGGISAFLITPTVSISNGAKLQFATRTLAQSSPNIYPDRLQVLMSQTGNTTIPTGTTSVGSFTTVMLDINPNLTTNSVSAVNNGSVNGYPMAWTVYTLQVTGVTGTVTGRFAFRYFVDDGGITGLNSRLVAVDAVRYSLPCGVSVQGYTICPNTSTTLTAIGGDANSTYTWSPVGGNSNSVVVTPASTTNYTLSYTDSGNSCPDRTVAVTVGAQLSINLTASSSTICSGNSVTLAASSAATTYSWNTGATTAVISVTPGVTTTYTAAGYVGTLPNVTCAGVNTIQITVNPSPTLGVALSPSVLCSEVGSITINASGANSYFYLGSSANPQSLATPSAGVWNFPLSGTAANGCVSSGVVVFTVNPNPTVTVSSNKTVQCINNTIILTGAGADSYSWSGASTSTANPLTYSTGTTAGNQTFSVVGTTSLGCSSAIVVKTVSVSLCTGIENQYGNVVETSVFPNPFSNELKIGGLNGSVQVYNSLGQVIINTQVKDTETINTSELAKGVYILKAFNNEGQELKTVKLLKN